MLVIFFINLISPAFAQESTVEEITEEVTNSINTDTTLLIISIIINAILASVVILQLFLYRQEISERLRPRIAITEFKRHQLGKIGFSYENFGDTPPYDVRIKIVSSRKMPSIKQVDIKLEDKYKIGLIMPKQIKFYLIEDLDENAIVEAKNDGPPYFLGIKIQYLYGKNKTGKDISIVQFFKDADNFSIEKQIIK